MVRGTSERITMHLWWLPLMITFLAQTRGNGEDREVRWLLRGNPVTKVVVERRVVTETTPSSCVIVPPSLPPCPESRLEISPTSSSKIVVTRSATMDETTAKQICSSKDVELKSTEAPGWGDFLGFGRTTVTDTVVQHETKVYHDPGVVVTFSLVGCQPSRLPFDLPFCDIDKTTNAEP